MQNYLILYNPYYDQSVIQKHLEILKSEGKVAFGKVCSKLRLTQSEVIVDFAPSVIASKQSDQSNPAVKIDCHANTRNDIPPFDALSFDFARFVCPFQLFLTDYENLFVAKVEKVCTDLSKLQDSNIAPKYYAEKNLDIETWFIIEDLRELVQGDFVKVRDVYLANFTTPDFGNHTFSIYGNPYTYPLEIHQKKPEFYFSQGTKHYIDALQSEEFITTKQRLIDMCLGADFERAALTSTLEKLTKAEMIFEKHRALKVDINDLSNAMTDYASAFEWEAWELCKTLVRDLSKQDKEIINIAYDTRGQALFVKDLLGVKPHNLGNFVSLLRNERIKELIKSRYNAPLRFYLHTMLPKHIGILQQERNPSAHNKQAFIQEALEVRALMLGIGLRLGESGAFSSLLEAKNMLKNTIKTRI
ncbi:HP0729 family protein [uncultured Helicobacter sp.]|uniref:HP0729 family protein n=1 Tax=uncultured Helicobacter sp. TaxID=175537 RepID=UPI0025982033|nr:HP0729 family protein [uncultured Helicobacter sp.]